eukprot:CAMPEP_0197177662 /NCGR_PEP_ID=MMETSP1423-20130617/3187_1 /TAXON_ID=476441 /ORGANISM="Pseudo-nitzschia heimii, Strain UNC1101" /LENGTH=419 /DNA_ID=CAMNT_0042627247 /DNA_START=218 /DNA_END=1477 /DNA_ORIENTATION=+
MVPETHRKALEELESIVRNPRLFTETIIPRLWSDDLHRKLFASTASSDLPRRISIFLPSTISSESKIIRKRKITKRVTISETEKTTNNVVPIGSSVNKSISNTHLGSKLAGDALVATAVTFGVAPFLTIIDKAIVESTAGTSSVLSSAVNSVKSIARNPIEYVRSPTFLMMWAVYGATYTTANAFKTLEEHASYSRDRSNSANAPGESTSKTAGKFKVAAFLGTTAVNSCASIFKDRAYARMFSGTTSSVSIPRASYAMWMMRDLSVIGSSFLLPDLVASRMVDYSHGDLDHERARNICQIGLPVLAQFVAGPFQYLGLDMYNRSLKGLTTAQAIVDRSKNMSKGIAPIITARIARIIPGYSFGGLANTKLRTAWREKLLERDVAAIMKESRSSASTASHATRMVALLHSSDSIRVNKR